MSTFNPPADIAQITLAKSSDVNAVKAATGIAFALLPNETKLQRGTVNFSVDTGTANSYVVTLDASITTYTDGLQVVFRPLNSNTDISTINLNGIGVRSIRLTDSNPIQAGDISAGAIIDVRYSTATGFFHLTPNSAIYAHDAGVSADAAAASQSAASTSASNAASSASSAAGSASSANTSATNAATSASSMTASVASCTASQSAAATSATNAATSASGASTSATNAASSATTATTQASNASTSATNAAASATTASTQASNAASSASTATTQATAAGTSATNAAASATAASGSASTASTQATNAASSASSASGSASTATTQASNASTSASAASTSATNAATSATTATTQAGIATTQATNAATSATAAAASYDSFDDRYLGAKASDPSVDNDGNALLTGALYWNTTASEMRVYSGSAWITAYLPAAGYLALSGGTMTGAITFASGQTVANLASGSAGTIPYQSASGTTAMLAAGTSGQVLTSNGAAAPTWATASGGGGTKTISNKTGAYTVVAGDLGKIINCTSGTFTVSLTAAASLGSGFTCTIWNTSNTSTDAITIDPSGAETIDGVSTLILRRGEGLAIVCDGTNWQVDDKKPMRCYAENKDKTDNGGYYLRPIASGNDSVAVGAINIVASGAVSFAAGAYGATASGANSLALGSAGNSIAGATCSTSIGSNSGYQGSVTATGAGAMALGGSYASGTDSFAAAITNNTSTYGARGGNSVAIGYHAKADGYGVSIGYNSASNGASFTAIAIGEATNAVGNGVIAAGHNASATADYSSAFGASASATSANSTSIGRNSSNQGSVTATGAGAMALGGSYASGTDSFAAAIANNTSGYGATGANSVAIGYQAKATGTRASAIGYSSLASGDYSVAIGWGATASGYSSSIAIGRGATSSATSFAVSLDDGNGWLATASGNGSVAIGQHCKSVQYGKYSFASGGISAQGDAQYGNIVLRGASTASVVILTSDGSGTASSTNQLALAANQAMVVKGMLIGKQVGGGNGIAAYEISASAVYVGGTLTLGAGVLTLIGSNTLPATFTAPTITADTTNGAIKITSGKSSVTNVYWVCSLQSTEVTGS